MTAHAWMDNAACGTMPGFLNLPAARQKAICAACPVRETCLAFSPITPADASLVEKGYPVYGGLSGREQIARLDPDLCPKGRHDRHAVGLDPSGWCRGCRRESTASYKARKKAEHEHGNR